MTDAPLPWALVGLAVDLLSVGGLACLRRTEAGELFEHGTGVRLLPGDRFVDEVPPYRGHGLAL